MKTDSAMTQLDWNETFSVNIEKFDQQHRILFGYVSKLGKSAMSQEDSERKTIGQTLDKLVKHVMIHFLDEEVEMYRHQFPDFEKHKEAHDLFLSQTRNFIVLFRSDKSGSVILNCEIVAFFTEWATDHLRDMDMEYVQYLNSRGVY